MSGLGVRVLFDVLDRVADLDDLLDLFVRDLDAELFLQRHDQLNHVQRIGVQVLDELGIGCDLLGLDAELFGDDGLQSIVNG
jgi:hypothetical protein